MRRKGRLLHSSILTAALFVFAAPAFAAEPAPGDVCANLNYIISTGGPETSGIHRLLRCDGTNWQLMMTIDASGHVGIGNPTPSAALDVLSADTVGDIFPAIFGGSTTEGVTLVVNNWEPNHHQAQIVFQDQWYVGNSLAGDTTDDFYIYNKATTSSPFGISPGNSVNLNAAVALTGDISPAQITANQNDYNPAGLSSASVLRLNSNASRNITSLAGGADGRVVTVMNIGSFPIVLKNDDGATGTAANRFALTGDLTLAAKQSAMLMYDSTASRWRQIANGTATGSGDNLGNHIATANIQLGSNWLSGDGGNEGITVDASGKVGIGVVPSFDLDIAVADKSGVLQLANTSSTADRYPMISVTNYSGATNGVPVFAMYRARGNSITAAAVQQWDGLGAIEFQGHDGVSSRNSAAKIEAWASENWSNTAHGSSLEFSTAPNGSTTKAVRLTIGNDGMVSLANGISLTGDISPAQITANQNDYNPAGLAGASVLRLNSNASRNVTSLAGGADGRILTVMNVGSFPIVLKNDDGATGTAANRFALTGDLTLAAKQSAMLMYDSTASRWRQIANGTATGSGDNLGNHTATANIQLGTNWLSGDGGNEGIRIDSSGNVGIDTPPVAGTRLSMADSGGGVAEIATLINSSAASAGTGVGIVYQGPSSIKIGGVGAMWEDGTGNNSGLYFNTRNTSYSSKMYLSAAGNLGIGTIGVPKEKLHIYSTDPAETGLTIATPGTGDQQAVLNLLTKSNGSDTLGDATSAGWQIWANGDGSTAFGAIGGPNTFGIGFANGVGWDPAAFQILSNGSVGIGTHANGAVPGATLDVGGSFALSGDISPAQITTDQNNYDPIGYDIKTSVLRLTSDASHSITGIVDGTDGRVLTILNVGTNPIVLSNQSASSTAANRFAFGKNVILAADQTAAIIYDSTSQRWRAAGLPFEPSAGCTGPSDCSSIGNVCSDGTVFFGCNPRTGIPLFTTRCDAGQTWSGSSCTGTRAQQYWANSSSTSSLRTTGVVSTYDGQGNTTALTNGIVNGTGDARTTSGLQTHNAAQYCADLSSDGHTDWYLPAEAELFVMAMNRDVIGSGTFVDATWYWSSTEEYPYNGAVMVVALENDASRGIYADGMLNKYELSYLRCIRQ